MHNASMIAMEPDRVLVQRQFAVATYSCPEQMGNTMAQFLTTVAAAMVANRTLLFEKCAHDRRRCKYSSSVECDRFYTRSAWLPSIDNVLPRLQRVADNGQSWVANSGQSWVANNDTKRILPKSCCADGLACCGIDTLPDLLVRFPQFNSLSAAVLLAQPYSLSRADSRKRAAGLFECGQMHAMGALFEATLTPTSEVSRAVSLLLHERQHAGHHIASRRAGVVGHSPPTFGIHWRLYGREAARNMGVPTCAMMAIDDHHRRHHSSGGLVAYASDMDSIHVLAPELTSHTVLQGAKANITIDGQISQHEGVADRLGHEHGPWAGMSAVIDLELLSHADTAFVGTESSTFSELAAARAAHHTLVSRGTVLDVRFSSTGSMSNGCQRVYTNASNLREERLPRAFAKIDCKALSTVEAYEQAWAAGRAYGQASAVGMRKDFAA